jgi:hypothetical protein
MSPGDKTLERGFLGQAGVPVSEWEDYQKTGLDS